MDKFKKISMMFLLVSIPAIIIFSLFVLIIPKPQIKLETDHHRPQKLQKEIVTIVSLGDSLTEGVGDSTESGGYVPLLKQNISSQTEVGTIITNNFGKAGDRSDQLLKRLKKDDKQQEEIMKADVITLSVGGNDLLKVIKKNFFRQLELSSFEKPRESYLENLKEVFKELRRLNPKAPIYQLGIYNPFYLNLKEVTLLQEVVDYWNEGTNEFLETQSLSYFIPINEVLYQGIEGQSGIGGPKDRETLEEGSIIEKENNLNNLMSDLDNFHPNNLGYQLVANEITKEMMRTKSEWLLK